MFHSTHVRRMFIVPSLLALAVASTSLVPRATFADHHRHAKVERTGLDGYCPVCIIDAKKWVKGNARHHATYDGVTYYFPSDVEKKKFEASPEQYTPALGGDCTVCYAMLGKRVPGSVRHAVRYQNRLFLFPGEKKKKAFRANPAKYADIDLALNGQCAVCLVKAGKKVPGKAMFTAIHNGFRYQFPSRGELEAFIANPEHYASRAVKMAGRMVTRNAGEQVSVVGRSGCAGCEHGVVPIGAPDELGLAINAEDGTVYVVEDAHRLFPKLYEDRYDGVQLKLRGTVIKRQGDIAWVKPSELAVASS